MNITITGASGFIGRRLVETLLGAGHEVHVLGRRAGANWPATVRQSVWDPVKGLPLRESLEGADAVIHLAGEPVAQRWTTEAKRRIRESRVTGTHNLVDAMSALARRPAALVSASAIGYYGDRGDVILEEAAPSGRGYLPEVCGGWEHEALAAEALGIRVAVIRIGMVLDARGGALRKMLPAFRLGIGGRLSNGKQWMSWIHLADIANLFRFAVENPARGILNGTAPEPVQNENFTRELASRLHRPAVFPVPTAALKLIFGEMAEVVLASQRVIPRATEAAGFRFEYSRLGPALADLLP